MNYFENLVKKIVNEERKKPKHVNWRRPMESIAYTHSRFDYDRSIEIVDRRLFIIPKHIRILGDFDFYRVGERSLMFIPSKEDKDCQDEFKGMSLRRCEMVYDIATLGQP
uniref:Uncharacterized protein n=1 Tax=viral metagenome TaxID=1070528 RepID=A0A6C0DRF4_9ZZZZ